MLGLTMNIMFLLRADFCITSQPLPTVSVESSRCFEGQGQGGVRPETNLYSTDCSAQVEVSTDLSLIALTDGRIGGGGKLRIIRN
jgi:hypothetical protein